MLKEVRNFCQARPSQFPVFFHPAREFPCAIEVLERRETVASDFLDHLGWIFSELPNKFLHPGVADTECFRPRTSRGPAVSAGEPQIYQAPDDARLLNATPRPRRTPS
jgi:hypothetical protein